MSPRHDERRGFSQHFGTNLAHPLLPALPLSYLAGAGESPWRLVVIIRGMPVRYLAAGLALFAASARADISLYFNDFQASVGSQWTSTSPYAWGQQSTPSPDDGSRKFLGYFGGNDVVRLTVADIPDEVTTLKLEFDAYLMWSWDGNDSRPVNDVLRGPDVFGFRYGAGGTPETESSWTFSHGNGDLSLQTYCDVLSSPCLPTTGAQERYTLGYRFEILPTEEDVGSTQAAPMDSVYHFVWEGARTGSTAAFSFYSNGLQVRSDLEFPYLDEAWGLDNVRLTAAIPEPETWALVGAGIALLAAGRRLRTRMA